MKLFFSTLLCICGVLCFAQNQNKFTDTLYLQPVEVAAIRATENAPFAKTNISKKEIEKNNLGQDLPFLLNQTPSVVINSDAGAGVGYTGIRIRGTDASRINVTLNGIPYNDAESQGTFFVDLPDFSSSTNSIQIQRGVGTSSNGAGAFGANINLSTNEINKTFFTQLNNSFGSFNTFKNTFLFGTGILKKHFTVDGRISRINSNGYIDRAFSNLKSFYVSAAYVSDKKSLRLNIFSGKEKTYQAWDGVPENLLNSNRTYNQNGTEKPGTPYNNETDNYTQTHYQLFYNYKINNFWNGNIALFFTKGKGYYEEYKGSDSLAHYGLPNYVDGINTFATTDLVRQLWLDNNFYGSIFSMQYKKNTTHFIFGGGANNYDGKHFGKIVWAQIQAAVPTNYKWYNLTAHKKDVNFYSKLTKQWSSNFTSFVDVQWRHINYTINGFANNPEIIINKNYNFINPKMGVTYNINNGQIYASYALAQHEPNRDDFEANTHQQPKPEWLNDFEMGIETKKANYFLGINLYYMKYKDQLILTGKINDVGAYTRTNIPNSYRAGIELQGKYIFTKCLNTSASLSFSKNKIKNFTEYLDDYDNGGQQKNFYNTTDISFSPSIVSSASLNFLPLKNAEINFISKYVSRQYLDNTAKLSRSLKPYYLQDIRLSYLIKNKVFKATNIIVQLNNIFSKKYEPNGYSYSYIYGGAVTTENYYFPMAPFNCMVGLNVQL